MLAVAPPFVRFGRLPLPISYLSPAVSSSDQEPSPGRVKSTHDVVSEWSRALRGTKSAQVSL